MVVVLYFHTFSTIADLKGMGADLLCTPENFLGSSEIAPAPLSGT
jgi:hypothetical protein